MIKKLLSEVNTLSIAVFIIVLSGCASNVAPENFASPSDSQTSSSVSKINTELQTALGPSAKEYRLGFGDTLDVFVYKLENVSREYQVNSKGEIQAPLIGAIAVGGLTVSQAQIKLRDVLSEKFMRNPQVTVSISEYGANEISVTGSVKQPDLYKVKEGRNPFEMLTMAGGLDKSSGRFMHITTRQRNSETDSFETVRLIVDMEAHIDPVNPDDFVNQRKIRDLVLKDGDAIFVPEAGLVYIDGAVKSPGSFTIERDTTIRSLIALAGGSEWSSNKNKVHVIRKIKDVSKSYPVNLAKISANKEPEFVLQPGDLVILGHNPLKRGVEGFFQYGLRLAFLL